MPAHCTSPQAIHALAYVSTALESGATGHDKWRLPRWPRLQPTASSMKMKQEHDAGVQAQRAAPPTEDDSAGVLAPLAGCDRHLKLPAACTCHSACRAWEGHGSGMHNECLCVCACAACMLACICVCVWCGQGKQRSGCVNSPCADSRHRGLLGRPQRQRKHRARVDIGMRPGGSAKCIGQVEVTPSCASPSPPRRGFV